MITLTKERDWEIVRIALIGLMTNREAIEQSYKNVCSGCKTKVMDFPNCQEVSDLLNTITKQVYPE